MSQLTKDEKRKFRALLFRHQDGLAISNSIAALHILGVLEFCFENQKITFDELSRSFPTLSLGYLNVALRSLASQGFFNYTVLNDVVSLETTPKLHLLKNYIGLYHKFSSIYKKQLVFLKNEDTSGFSLDNEVLRLSKTVNELTHENRNDAYFHNEVLVHLEGVLLLPVLVKLSFSNESIAMPIVEVISKDDKLSAFFENLSMYEKGKLTQKGRFLIDKSYAYGVTTSYLPIMTNVKHYLEGNFNEFFKRDSDGNEQHVFRTLNVWGSGGSHATYFKKIDEVLLEIFNKPLEEQPKGIIDVGCGNGALLEHIFNLIWNQTNRREDLDKNKLILIGADYNKEALLSTQQNLKKADVWAEVVWGRHWKSA